MISATAHGIDAGRQWQACGLTVLGVEEVIEMIFFQSVRVITIFVHSAA